ncbi:MAG: peroxiredoxin [Alphaproteobacteria bacterium]|jgi:peroxiredoxin Q/BCP
MSELTLNKPAPKFTLETEKGEINNHSFEGKFLVLYFYPKDDTPGCTIEAQEFSADLKEFKKLGAEILGVSKDSIESHQKFCKKYSLDITLASDAEGKTIESYGSWVEKNMYGKKYMGIQRDTFLIDKKGILKHIWRKVKPEGHSKEVLEAIKKL